MVNTIIYEKKLLTALVHYILAKLLPKIPSQYVAIVFDDILDTVPIKHTFLEWQKIISYIDSSYSEKTINIFSLFLEHNSKKLDLDSIIEFHQFVDKCSNISDYENLCVLLQQSVLQKEMPTECQAIKIEQGNIFDFENITSLLIRYGYVRREYVESIGEFAIRGAIVDLWPNGFSILYNEDKKLRTPVRIVLEDNIVLSIKQFDITTQRSYSYDEVKKIEIFPVDFDCWIQNAIQQTGNTVVKLEQLLSNKFFYIFCSEQQINDVNTINIPYFPSTRYFGDIEHFKKDIEKLVDEKYKIFIGYNYNSELNKLSSCIPSILLDKVNFIKTSITSGFCSKEEKLVFTTFHEVFSKFELFTYPKQKIYHGVKLDNIWEIQPGDYVVHNTYGIAKFVGMKKLNVHGVNKEFLTLLFRDNALLYVPLIEIDTIEKYVSLTEKPPALSPLAQETWNKKVSKIKSTIKEFIYQLYTLYTKRKQIKGIKFERDVELEKMFAETFEYEETEDQKKAIEDVLQDMSSEYPMDRIIVGDVGFGKTEVALRAAFTAVYNGRQVAVLCPTTVLAEQHYRIFVDRFDRFGFKVGILTRLQPQKYIEETTHKIAEGEIDIVVGTHLLLSDKIKFADLGLVIIDEEHKFGVRQKEKIRLKFRSGESLGLSLDNTVPDVLSLTATPIPRTLAFGLEGIKDISVIETPPEGRLPIETYVLPYDEQIIADVINRELHRNGQVYYVFNDISLIEHKTNKIKSYFPTAVVEYLHSKLSSKKIEEIMTKFVKEEIQILVTTTIIESGLDIPNVNTIIVENVEHFGLAQLYQLRGRVGRREKKAYCYLFYSDEKMTTNAKKRISALLEFTSLGSGYKLSLRDLEIRGAGEILGTKQHGFVNEIGLSMYSKIIQQLITEIAGKKYEEVEPKIKVDIEAYLPEDYIPDSETRILFYRKLMQAKNVNEIDMVKEEIYDRFGKPLIKSVVDNLFLLANLRVQLKKYKISQFYVYQDQEKVGNFELFISGNDQNLFILMRKQIHCIDNAIIEDCNKNIIKISSNNINNTVELLKKLLNLLLHNVK